MRIFRSRSQLAAENRELRSKCEHLEEIITHYREALTSFGEGYRARWAEDAAFTNALARPKGDQT